MNYLGALKIMSSYIDASVNTSYSEVTRLDYKHLAYWFCKVIEYSNSNKKEIQESYLNKILSDAKCHSFGMYDFLVEEGLIVKGIIPCAACNYAEGTESIYGTLYCTSCAQL